MYITNQTRHKHLELHYNECILLIKHHCHKPLELHEIYLKNFLVYYPIAVICLHVLIMNLFTFLAFRPCFSIDRGENMTYSLLFFINSAGHFVG